MFLTNGKGRKWFVLISIIALILSLATACGTSREEAEEYTPTPEDYTVTVTGSFPLYTDPAVGSNAIEASALFNLYDPLVFPALDGEIKPHLATEWEVSPDGMQYTFHIRKGVKFHDGTELTAEDVAFSMNRLLTIGEGFAYLYTDYIDNAEVVDDYTVQFNMKKTFGPLVPSLVRFYVLNKDLVMEHIEKPGPYGDMGDYGKKWLLANDAGSGPYEMVEMKMEESMLAQKFQDYWQDFEENTPEFFKVISWCDPVTVRTLMAQRELTITDEWQSIENINNMDQIEGVDVAMLSAGAIGSIDLNTKKPPTDDVHFRKALAYLMDYKTVTTNIYPGANQPVGPVAPVYNGHNPDLMQYEFNKEKALEELKKSKYYGKLDQYPVTLAWSADVPDEEKISLLLQANAKELGINIEIQKTPFVTLIQQAQSIETTPNATIMYPGDSYNEAGSVLALRYHSNTSGTFTQFEWLLNDDIDAAIEEALSTVDKEERYAKYYKIQEDIVEMCPTIWVFEFDERRAYQAAYVSWLAADYAEQGKLNCPIMGRFIYLPEMKIDADKKAELMGKK